MAVNLRLITPSDPDEPIEAYLQEVKAGTTNIHPYERLMIWYRKAKNYEDEISIINKGIARLKKFYADQQKGTLGKKINPSVKELSARISKSTGLHDRKGNEIYLPDPLPKWIKRKEVAEEKLRKQKTKASKQRKRKK